jgi:hypothetical protein
MNLIIGIIIGVIIYLIITCNNVEKLENLSKYSNINESTECCEIKKVVLTNNNFGYNYNLNENCSRNFNSNHRNIFKNEIIDNKPFTLDKCSNKSNLIGSCRKIGFECVDFTTPEDCKKYQMTWSNKTCHDKITS